MTDCEEPVSCLVQTPEILSFDAFSVPVRENLFLPVSRVKVIVSKSLVATNTS